MGDTHAYGYSCGFLSRRLYLVGFCFIMFAMCLMSLFRWVGSTHILDMLMGNIWEKATNRCIGEACYEVFSCMGMKNASQKIREPLASLSGLMFFPLGGLGALRGSRWNLLCLFYYLAASAAVHCGLIIIDLVYTESCSAYPENLVRMALLPTFPPAPIGMASKAMIQKVDYYPVADVDKMIGIDGLQWYLFIAIVWVLLLAYTGNEARLLANLIERGPLGLGLHYGLGQFYEVINHDAVLRHKEKYVKSKFIDDCKLPLIPADVESPYGYVVDTPSYGTYWGETSKHVRFPAPKTFDAEDSYDFQEPQHYLWNEAFESAAKQFDEPNHPTGSWSPPIPRLR